ncbi:MAG: GntR family transcriptional regulator [Synergistales bacterium]|nr:GntR family transcriptional regulator [Synergistales bacterium]
MRGPVVYPSSTDIVYNRLKQQILKKELTPGQRLPEKELAEGLEVSRTPVREALRRLASDHLVDLIPNGGARLASPTQQEVRDTYQVRQHLESLSIQLAMPRITPLFLCRLEENIAEEEEIFQERDLERYIDINSSFHLIIAEAGGNSVLIDYLENLLTRTFAYMVFFESFFDFDTNPSLGEHRALVRAMRMGHAQQAKTLMEQHIAVSEQQLKCQLG